MSKRIAWLAAASLSVASVALGYWQYREANKPMFLRGENEEEELGRPPVDGDYWAIRVGYHGDPNNLRFEPRWMLDAKVQDQRIASGVPAGKKTYTKAAGTSLALDPDAFTLLGPQPLAGEGFGAGNNAGRTNVLLGDPDDPAIAYLGSDGGGVWKTTNCCTAATTWEIKTDFPEIASMAIGDLTVDPNNHNVLYAGTGDLRYGSFSFGSAGVLKSTDKGETWVVLGEDVFNPLYGPSAGGFPQYQAISKVVVDPNDSNNVVVGTKTGVYFSYDAGQNWSGPCYTNTFTTPPTNQRQDVTGVLALDNGGTTMVYAAVGTRGYGTPVQPDLSNTGANGVYRATMPSSGCPAVGAWTLLNNNWPAVVGQGTPQTQVGRIELAAAPSDAQTIYAMASDANNATRGVQGVYKSTDGGTTWTQTGTSSSFSGCNGTGNQMWYDAGITVSPTDPNTLFASTVDLFRSTNSGANFTNLTNSYCGGPVHPDNHARAFVGGDSNKLLNGNDGGVYYTGNAMAGASWIALNDSLSTIEIYHGDITANFATSSTPGATGGFQDNGSASVQWTGDPGPAEWEATNGGDGIVSRIEPVLGQWWYTSIYYAAVYVSTTGPFGNQQNISPPLPGSERASFLTPFDLFRNGVLDAPDGACTTAGGCKRIILGTQRVWESTTGGRPSSSWTAKTGDITKNNLVLNGDNRSYINQIHYSVNDPTVAIAGTNDGNVAYIYDLGGTGAATAVDITAGNVVLPNRPIQDVTTDPTNPWIGYAAVGGFSANTPSQPGHVFMSTCTTHCSIQQWNNVSGNLPDIPANAIVVNPRIPAQVFVGTDWGLYYTDNVNAQPPVWQRFEGLPHVMIWSLSIDRGFTTLAAFTRSRGAWAWPLPQPEGGSADLGVTISPPTAALPGNEFFYTITVTNNGPDEASNVALQSALPNNDPSFTFKGNTGDCTTAFPCVFPTLASGASVQVTTGLCVPRPFEQDSVIVHANVSSATPDPNPGNDTTEVPIPTFLEDFADGFDCP
jgi:uncharacterized repeat protein (TIGR01451 family)